MGKKRIPGKFLYKEACRNKVKKLYLCSPWPVNNDGSIYGIDIFELDSKTNEWQRRLVIDFSEENEKYGFGCVCVCNKLIVIGGERCFEMYGRLRFEIFDNVESYDMITGKKGALPRIPNGGRSAFWTIAVDKYIYVFGGQNIDQQQTNDCMRLDVELQVWETLQPMPEEYARSFEQNSIRELNGLIFVACGSYLESFFIYNSSADIWSRLTPQITTIRNPVMFKWNEKLYVLDDGVLNQYDVEKDTWSSINMNAGNKDIMSFKDAIEFLDNIFVCASASSQKRRSYLGMLKMEGTECTCTFNPTEETSSILRPGCFLFLN